MKSIDGRNNIKIYNLSAGKSLPDWLSSKKRRKLLKRNADMQMTIELLQDFTMPDICNRVTVSEDGQYIIVTGTYKPRVKCFDVSALSLKFERCLDADVVDVLLFTEDYKKMVFLEEERYLEFHNQGGRWYRTRIPKFGRDMAYHYPSCDLYIGASGNEIYRMNLLEGRFNNSIFVDSASVNKCIFNPVHYLFTVGTSDGKVEAWDPRSRQRVGLLDCTRSMLWENVSLPYHTSVEQLGITALAYRDGLNLAVGTYTGQVLLYDIRSMKPYLVKNKLDDSPIIDLEFHPHQDIVYSLSKDSLNIWDSNNGKSYTCIESDVKYNDLCTIPGSGMIFIAGESPKMESYFIPSLGPAPKWCGHLDALVEELEEEDIPASYDDYKFVTEQELNQLGLDSLIGTKCLRAVMHGYYLDVRLYNKARSAVNLMDKESLVKQKVKQKLSDQKEKLLRKQKKKESKILPDINRELFVKLKDEAEKKDEKSLATKTVLEDPRFAAMFHKNEFNIDKETDSYRLIQPLGGKLTDRFKQLDDSDEEDTMNSEAQPEQEPEEGSSDSDDSIVSELEYSAMEEEEEEIPAKFERSRKKSKKGKDIIKSNPASDKPMKSTSAESRGFRSADSLTELNQEWGSSMKTISIGELLQKEETIDNGEDAVQEHTYGSREMKFKLDKADNKFEALRKQQKEHHQHRKTVVRKTKHIKGNIRMNKPHF